MKMPRRGESKSAASASQTWWSLSAPGSKKKIMILAAAALLLLLGGGLYAWHARSVYQQSPEFALERLNTAIQTGDQELLTQLLDSERLAASLGSRYTSLAPAIAEQFARINPALSAPEPELASEAVRRYLNELFSSGKKKHGEDNTALVPPDAAALLKGAPFGLESENSAQATLGTTLDLPFRNGASLKLRLEKHDKWQIVDVPNAETLLQAYLEHLVQLGDRAEEAREIDREIQISGMQRNLPNLVCRAGITRIGNAEGAMVLVISADPPPLPEGLNGFGVMLHLKGADGTTLLSPYVQDFSPLPPGSPLRRTFTQPIDDALYARLEAAGPLLCSPTPQFVRLSSQKIFRYKDESGN